MFQTFWHITEIYKLEVVYLTGWIYELQCEPPYSLFHFSLAQDYIDDPYLYFTTKEILFDSFVNTYYQMNKDRIIIQGSYEFDSYEKLDELSAYRLNLFFGSYIYPREYFNELKKISVYCEENDIELKFMILLTYQGMEAYLKNDSIPMRNKFKRRC